MTTNRIDANSSNIETMIPPDATITLKASGTNGSGNNQADEVSGFKGYTTLTIMLKVTADSGTSPTLDVAIQRLLPDGVTWDTIVRFTQITGAASPVDHIADVVATGEGTRASDETETVTSATLAAGAVRNVPWGDTLRVIDTIGGSDTPTFTYEVIAAPRP